MEINGVLYYFEHSHTLSLFHSPGHSLNGNEAAARFVIAAAFFFFSVYKGACRFRYTLVKLGEVVFLFYFEDHCYYYSQLLIENITHMQLSSFFFSWDIF